MVGISNHRANELKLISSGARKTYRKIKANREMEERYMLLEDLIKEEREEAKAEGKVEGKAEGKAEMLLVVLSTLGEVSEELQKKIMSEKDENVLLSYVQKASKATSMDEFLRMIK